MTQSAIIEQVSRLAAALESAQGLTGAERKAIAELEAQIEQILFHQDLQRDASQDPEQYLLNRFEDKLVAFEQNHPAMSGIIRKLSNSLSNIGV